LLPQSSEKAIQDQVELWEFIEGFADFPQDIPLQNIHPATSTVIYKTMCENWTPENFQNGLEGVGSFERITHGINHQEHTLIIITAKKVAVDWAHTKDIYNWDWELYVLFWDQEQNLLFINSSSNNGMYGDLAKAIAGEDVELVEGPNVFRCFSGVNRLKLQNVGLIQKLGRLIRYTMRAGSDVEAGLSEAQRKLAAKANIFGVGFSEGSKTSVGCSYKGRIWSHRSSHVHQLTKWCSTIGKKALDETIDPDEVLKGTLVPKAITDRPQIIPVFIEWPEIIYLEPEIAFEIIVDENSHLPIYNTDINLIYPAETGDIQFEIRSGEISVQLSLALLEKNGRPDYEFSVIGGQNLIIKRGAKQTDLRNFFVQFPPTVWFVDGSSLTGNVFTELKRKAPP
jgi:hypothetical protein